MKLNIHVMEAIRELNSDFWLSSLKYQSFPIFKWQSKILGKNGKLCFSAIKLIKMIFDDKGD